MSDKSKILNKIEFWIDKLPYISFRIEITMPNEILILEKTKRPNKITGFGRDCNE